MTSTKHPIWFIMFIAVVLAAGLVYCQLAYANGVDVPKDTVLIGGVASLVGLWFRFTGGDKNE